jgi:Na+-transporting NADH:ubiquinone oxidoreductase subunit F
MLFISATVTFVGLLVIFTALLIIAERFLTNYGVCKIDINAGARVLEVEGGQSLLASLIQSKVFIPSACGGHGTCGHCKVTAQSGAGPVLPTEVTYLTRKEIRTGMRLACQVKVRRDVAIKIPEDLLNVKMFSAIVKNTRDVTHDIKELRFQVQDNGGISHRPGQYVQIQAPSPEGPVFRAYSISSPTFEKNIIELNVRIVPGGIASPYLHSLKENDPVVFTGPYGEFRLNEDPAVEIICVGGGCGMAPMKNIIYSLYHTWPLRSCWLFFGCRTTRDVFYLDEYKDLANQHPDLKVVYALSDPLPKEQVWDGERGFIHLSVDKKLVPGVKRQAFLCGPPPMIDAVTQVLIEKGLSPGDIFYDKF